MSDTKIEAGRESPSDDLLRKIAGPLECEPLISSITASSLAAIERDLVDRYVERLADHGVEVDADRTWTLYRASASDFYVSALVTAGTSDRMQPAEISDIGVDRVIAAMHRLETFDILDRIVAGEEI